MPATTPAKTPRTRLRRNPKRAVYDRAVIDEILDTAPICHLGFTDPQGQPYVLPTLHARVGDQLLLHGSAAGRAMKTLAAGAPVCVTVTHVDGLVLARSAFHHSMNYRCAVLLGTARLIESVEEKERALEAFTEKLLPGRWAEVRWPSRQELRATKVLALPIDETSAKIRTGPPQDDAEDYALHAWAGVIPLSLRAGAPIPDPEMRPGTPGSAALQTYTDAGGAADGDPPDARAADGLR